MVVQFGEIQIFKIMIIMHIKKLSQKINYLPSLITYGYYIHLYALMIVINMVPVIMVDVYVIMVIGENLVNMNIVLVHFAILILIFLQNRYVITAQIMENV